MDAEPRPLLGKSGRRRIGDDDYNTPALASAALALGLEQAGLRLPLSTTDPCGGGGQLADTIMALAPGVDVRLADLKPRREPAERCATLAPVDATILADLESLLRITGARAIITNPPFGRLVYPAIFANLMTLLRRGDVDLVAVMQVAGRHLHTKPAYAETAGEPLYAACIACPWRAYLWPKGPGSKNPFGGYCWHVYAPPERLSRAYPVYTVTEEEAEEALKATKLDRPSGDQRELAYAERR
jgi:hypothetical protein